MTFPKTANLKTSMPMKQSLIAIAGLLALACVAEPAQAENFQIAWNIVGGGGGACSGGQFTLTGTVGQSDLGTATGGRFSSVGGFWAPDAAAPKPHPKLRV